MQIMRKLLSLMIIYIGLINSGFCQNEFPSIKVVDHSYVIQPNSTILVSNIPPLRAQGALGICYAHAAATLMEAEDCKIQNIKDCKKINDKDRYAAMGLAEFGGPVLNGNDSPFTYEIREGGSIGMVTQRIALDIGYSASESCLSYEKIFKFIPNVANQLNTLQYLNKIYEDFKKHCLNCKSEDYEKPEYKKVAQRLKNKIYDELKLNITDYGQPRSDQNIWNAFTTESYEKFLYELLKDKQCNRMANVAVFMAHGKVSVQFYPIDDKVKGNYNESIATIKKVLLLGRPIGLSNICIDETPRKDCSNYHALVINGYRKTCNNKNQCIDAVKVINTWGQKWQDDHDDGWLNAKLLLDSSFYQTGTLTWFEDKK